MSGFSNVYGHEDIIESLKKSLAADSYSHAYIFDGIAGVGKRLLAGLFAKALLCTQSARPCDECISCRAFDARNHPDIIFVSSDKRSIGVEDIRDQVGSAVHIRPYKYKHKIFILDNADKMSVQAQNALLKTLEEPPSYAVFLLISTNINNFLPTILSRCVTLKLKPLPVELVARYLADKGIEHSDMLSVSIASGGSIGKACRLIADDTFNEQKKEIHDLLNNLPGSNLWDILLLAKRLEKFKDHSAQMLEFMHIWYRDALIHKATGSSARFMQKDSEREIIAFSERMSFKKLVQGLDGIISAGYSLRYNSNYLLTMEVMLMRMAGY